MFPKKFGVNKYNMKLLEIRFNYVLTRDNGDLHIVETRFKFYF